MSVRELTVDVVCIGSGIGGLSAAISAAEAGLEAIVLEKTEQVGGVTAYSMGGLWVAPNVHQRELGLEDSVDNVRKYMQFLAADYADENLLNVYLERGPEILEYFHEKIGLRTKIIRGYSDYYYPFAEGSTAEGRFLEPEPFPAKQLGDWAPRTRLSPHVPYGLTLEDMGRAGGPGSVQHWDYALMQKRLENDERCLGPALAAYFVKGALDKGVELWTESPATGLTMDQGRVTGVRSATPEGEVLIHARRGVVIATGGYDWNEDFARYYEHWPEFKTSLFPGVEGDHLVLGSAAGAMTAAIPSSGMPMQLGFALPGEEHEGKPLYRLAFLEYGLPHAILVDDTGQRFADESFYRDVLTKIHGFSGHNQKVRHWPVWVIFDQQHRDKYPFGSAMPGTDLPEGFATTANSLEQLAEKTGIDAAGLTKTVERFNGFCQTGQDEDFQRGSFPWSHRMCGDTTVKPNPNLGPIQQAPFYAVQLTVVGAGNASAGLKINETAQVINAKNEPIPGLYAAGNSVAYLDLGRGYQSGMANIRGMIQGYLAGVHCAAD